MKHLEWIETGDGSMTVRDVQRDVTYRSTDGARAEALHVFVEGTDVGMNPRCVLEFGFGLATNFCLTATRHPTLDYFAVERAPVDPEYVAGDGPAADFARDALEQLHVYGSFEGALNGWRLSLVSDWRELSGVAAHSVYHDPFGPTVEPASWSADVFAWEAGNLRTDGILGTYSAATSVRRAMASAGLCVSRVAGIGRKREITLAARDASVLKGKLISREKLLG
ncbi:MAG: MnmC family methyltransferase [bacterium]